MLSGLGFFALVLAHFAWLNLAPGWHLDEAWAGLYAQRIALEPGFWPLQAMVPYTLAWAHYLTAIFFRVFGISVVVYRAVGELEVFLGVALLSRALWNWGEKRAATLLPGVVAFFPALVMNHRFVIDMNTFHVLCAGIVALGMSFRRRKPATSYALMGLGAFFGVTSHVVFFGPLLAAWFCLFVDGRLTSRMDRVFITGFLLSLFPFLGLVYATSSDSFQATALMALVVALILVHLLPPQFWAKIIYAKKIIFFIPLLIGVPLLVPFTLFIEGSWLALFSNGYLEVPALRGLIFIPVLLMGFYLWQGGARPVSRVWLSFLPAAWILTTLMVVKPGPRYYEIIFLTCAVALAAGWARLKTPQLLLTGSLWIILGSLQLGFNYFKPALQESQIDRTFHLGRFRDSSGDFLAKGPLVRALAAQGCRYENLEIVDERLNLVLKFLAWEEWTAAGLKERMIESPRRCPGRLRIDGLQLPLPGV